MTNSFDQFKGYWTKAKDWCRENRPAAICLAIIFFVVLLLIILKVLDTNRYTNKILGYEIKGPDKWEMVPSKDRSNVTFKKFKKNDYVLGNAVIKMKVEYGNPYGNTSLDYVVNGLLPQAEYTYERNQGKKISLREEPYTVRRGNIEWATLSFLLDYAELQIIFVTMINDNMYIVALNSTTKNQQEDEKLFLRAVKSVRIKHIKRKNSLIDKGRVPLF